MFRLSNRLTILRRVLLVAVILTAIFSAAAIFLNKNKEEGVNAITPDGGTVNIVPGEPVYYDGWTTNWFTVNSGGQSIRGFCAQPRLGTPAGNYTAIEMNDDENRTKLLKLMIYIKENDNSYSHAARAAIFEGWIDTENERYAWSHAIIGAIYDGDYTGISEAHKNFVNRSISILQGYIDNEADVWVVAQNYKVFRTSGGGTVQDIVWIETTNRFGNIKVKKCDSDTRQCTPQGNATLGYIKFEVYNDSGDRIFNPYTKRFYDNGEMVASGITDNNGEITFSNLLANDTKYLVKETETNASYNLTAGQQTTVLSEHGETDTLTFYDTVKKGKITVNKIDKDTGTCTTSTGTGFAGTTFQLVNTSINAVYYNGTSYAKNAVIATKTLTANECSFAFNNLPFGNYQIKETAAADGYVLDSTPKNIIIPTNNNYNLTATFENQAIRGDVRFVKMDESNNRPMTDAVFSISLIDENKEIRETHIVVSNKDGIVDTSSAFALHTNNTNGYDVIYDANEPVLFKGFGTWFSYNKSGNPIVPRDDVGALPKGTYIIQELKCDANFFCSNIMNEKITVEITRHGVVEDLGDWNNTCAKFEVGTQASDAKDGDKYVEVGKEVQIKDTVEYCGKPNVEYTIKGVLMDKSTGKELLIDGKPVESSVTVKPKEECETAELIFTFDGSELGGKEIVVFERLYYKSAVMAEHEDLEDEGQTVRMIDLHTYAVNKATNNKNLPLDEEVEVKDTVYYCFEPGLEYTIKGIMMNKNTGNGLLVKSKPVEAEVTFTPEKACGEIEMFYKFSTTGLGGASLVIFESLYLEDELLIEHRDFNNVDQTVVVDLPIPDSGYSTATSSNSQSQNEAIIIIAIVSVGIVGYFGTRYAARRRVFRK